MSKPKPGTIYLIPTPLGKTGTNTSLPEYNLEIIRKLRLLMVENLQTARSFIQWVGNTVPDYAISFELLDKNTPDTDILDYLKRIEAGNDAGVMSEAGVPGVADPGSRLVKLAHKKGITVVPLVGPSSILLALMASGFNGQSFSFHGYLPIKPGERDKKISELEKISRETGAAQIFMEAPHRNNELLKAIIARTKSDTSLCTASNLTLPNELIVSQSVLLWKHVDPRPDLNRKPTIFILQAASHVGKTNQPRLDRKKWR